MGEVAAVLAQAAVSHLVAAHVELEVLLELANLGVLEGGGADDVHQAPGGRGVGHEPVCRPPSLAEAPSLYLCQTLDEDLLPGCLPLFTTGTGGKGRGSYAQAGLLQIPAVCPSPSLTLEMA